MIFYREMGVRFGENWRCSKKEIECTMMFLIEKMGGRFGEHWRFANRVFGFGF